MSLVNDTLSVKACLCKRRQFGSNGAASIQKIHTVQRTSSLWWVVWVIRTVIFTHLFDSESGKNSNFEGSNRRRSTTWNWGIILILFWFGVWFRWLDGIILLRVVFWRCSIAECQHWYNGRYILYYMPRLCVLTFNTVAPWRWN